MTSHSITAAARCLAIAAIAFLVTSCFVPDRFSLKVSMPEMDKIAWTYDGSFRFFGAGFDPRRDKLRPQDITGLTRELEKLPGTSHVAHAGGVEWRQAIAWKRSIGPEGISIPTAQPIGQVQYWLVRVSRESANSVLLETAHAGRETANLKTMGYTSSGTLEFETSATIEQISGRAIARTWYGFGSAHYVSWGIFDEPIKLRLSWPSAAKADNTDTNPTPTRSAPVAQTTSTASPPAAQRPVGAASPARVTQTSSATSMPRFPNDVEDAAARDVFAQTILKWPVNWQEWSAMWRTSAEAGCKTTSSAEYNAAARGFAEAVLGGYDEKETGCITTRYLESGYDGDCKLGVCSEVHAGVDLRSKEVPAAQVRSFLHGRARVNPDGTKSTLVIESDDGHHKVLFLHMDRIDVVEGQCVKNGDVVGVAGSVGTAERHLHVEVWGRGSPIFDKRLRAVSGSACQNRVCTEAEVRQFTTDPVRYWAGLQLAPWTQYGSGKMEPRCARAPQTATGAWQALRFQRPAHVVFLNKSVKAKHGNAQYTVSLTRQGLRILHADGRVSENVLEHLIDPESCSLTPTGSQFLVICRDIDWGPLFLSFLDPYFSRSLPNLLNPLGRGFHLPAGCAPSSQPDSGAGGGCFAPLGGTIMVALHAWHGEIGSNLIAVDSEMRRVVWPKRISRVNGVDELRSIAAPHPHGLSFWIENSYRIAGKSGDYVLYSSPARFRGASRVIEVAGEVAFHEWQKEGEGHIADTPTLKAPVVWQFEWQ